MSEPLTEMNPPGGAASLTERVMDAIMRKVTPEQIADGIHTLITAKLKNGDPNERCIESGIKLYLNYTIGMPVQRQQIVTQQLDAGPTLADLVRDPEAVRAIASMLAGSQTGRDALALALRSAPIEAETVPQESSVSADTVKAPKAKV